MNLRRVPVLSIALLLLILLEGLSFTKNFAGAFAGISVEKKSKNFSEIAIIVNPENPVSTISSKDLKNIYKLKKNTWPTGKKIEAVNLKKRDPIRKKFSYIILAKSASRMDKFYLKQALSGKGQPPRVLSSSGDVLDFVRYNKNAIGYIDIKEVDDSVKVLSIEDISN